MLCSSPYFLWLENRIEFPFIITKLPFLGPSTWALATGKNDMMTILISKLIDDGISLYKVNFLFLLIHPIVVVFFEIEKST